MRALALEGAGIAALGSYLVMDDIKAGRLQQLLTDYDCGTAGIFAVYPDRRYQQAKVRLFIDYLGRRAEGLV